MVELFANSADSDQTPYSTASDLGLHCLPVTVLGSPDYNGLKDLKKDKYKALRQFRSWCTFFPPHPAIFR